MKIPLKRSGNPGTVTLEITAATTGDPKIPTGPVLTSGTFNGNDLSDTAYTTINFQLAPVELSAGTWYCWYIKALSGDAENKVIIEYGAEP
jgi:hypothetical protein